MYVCVYIFYITPRVQCSAQIYKRTLIKYNDANCDKGVRLVIMLLTALAKVQAVTGQSPSLPVMKGDLKTLALTADALNLDHNQAEEEADTDVVKPPTQRIVEPVRITPAFHVLTANIANPAFGHQNPVMLCCVMFMSRSSSVLATTTRSSAY